MPISQKFNLYQYLKNVGDDVPAAHEPTSDRQSCAAVGAGSSNTIDVRSRLRQLAAVEPVEQVIDDPVLNTEDAATILGLRPARLEKWRQRGMGPEYLQYDQDGIRYELSSLVAFKASRRARPSRQPHPGRAR